MLPEPSCQIALGLLTLFYGTCWSIVAYCVARGGHEAGATVAEPEKTCLRRTVYLSAPKGSPSTLPRTLRSLRRFVARNSRALGCVIRGVFSTVGGVSIAWWCASGH